MRFATSGLHGGQKGWWRLAAITGIGLTVVGAINLGCPQPTYQQMYPGVPLSAIMKITEDQTLTNDQKTQALKDLGITDDQVIILLVNGPKPVTAQQST